MRVFIIAAVSADGFIARDHEELADWSSPEDKQLFVKLTKEAGVMIMGSRTYDTIGRPLPGRKTIVYTSRPEKYNIDGLVPTNDPPQKVLETLAEQGYNAAAICGGSQIYTQFLQAGVVNELYLTVEPVLFGAGVKLCSQQIGQAMRLLDNKKLNDNTILLHYALTKTDTV